MQFGKACGQLSRLLWAGIFTLSCFSHPCPAGEHDMEWWSWVTVSKDLDEFGFPKEWKLILDYQHRKNRDAERLFERKYTFSLQIPEPYSGDWSLAGHYRRVDQETGPNEDRYYFDLERTWKRPCGMEYDLKFRTRFDIRDFDNTEGVTYRVRPFLDLSRPFPWQIVGRPVRAYTNAEAYWDSAPDLWNRYRLGAGFRIPVSQQATLTLGYQMEANYIIRTANWDYDNMIMTGIGFKF